MWLGEFGSKTRLSPKLNVYLIKTYNKLTNVESTKLLYTFNALIVR